MNPEDLLTILGGKIKGDPEPYELQASFEHGRKAALRGDSFDAEKGKVVLRPKQNRIRQLAYALGYISVDWAKLDEAD